MQRLTDVVWLRGLMAKVEQMSIRIAEETTNLFAPVVRTGKKPCSPGPEYPVGFLTVGYAYGHRVAHAPGILGRRECHIRFILGWSTSGQQEQPASPKPQDAGGASVFPVDRGT